MKERETHVLVSWKTQKSHTNVEHKQPQIEVSWKTI